MKAELMKAGKAIGTFVARNSPRILMGGAIAGLGTTVVFSIKDTTEAQPELNFEETQKGEKLTFKEKVKVAYKYYWRTALGVIGTTACIIGGHTIQEKRTAALAALYTLSESTLKDYKDKIIETKGKKEEEKITNAILADKVKGADMVENVIHTGEGETLCYEPITGRYFRSDINSIRRAENDTRQQLYGDLRVSLNEFFDFLKIPRTELGDEMGWNSDEPIELRFTSSLTSNGTPVLVVDHNKKPYPWYMGV